MASSQLELPSHQRLWLETVYNLTKEGRPVDVLQVRVELREELPSGFTSDVIDERLYKPANRNDGQAEITLLGIYVVNPNAELFQNVDTVIRSIKNHLIERPGAVEFTSEDIADKSGLKVETVEVVFGRLNELGHYWSGATRGQERGRFTKIQVATEGAVAAYLEYDGLDAVMEKNLKFLNQPARALSVEGIRTASDLAYSIVYGEPPLSIRESLTRFQRDHPDPRKVAFLMMRFGSTEAHSAISAAVGDALSRFGIECVRADTKQYHDDLFPNVLTCIHGSGFCISVFERIETESFNPNVSLEVGYAFALKKPVLLLKDCTLTTLHTDLVGKLYRVFDPQHPAETIPEQIEKWLTDKEFLSG